MTTETMIIRDNYAKADTRTGFCPAEEFEVLSTPVPFDRIEAHCELGGRAIGTNGEIVAVFGPGNGPMFEGLWVDFTWYIVVNYWAGGVKRGAAD